MSGLRLHVPGPAERIAARQAWIIATCTAWREAQRQMDKRCTAAVEWLSEDDFEQLCDEEQAKVDAIRAQMVAVKEKDMWPRELYWGGI